MHRSRIKKKKTINRIVFEVAVHLAAWVARFTAELVLKVPLGYSPGSISRVPRPHGVPFTTKVGTMGGDHLRPSNPLTVRRLFVTVSMHLQLHPYPDLVCMQSYSNVHKQDVFLSPRTRRSSFQTSNHLIYLIFVLFY